VTVKLRVHAILDYDETTGVASFLLEAHLSWVDGYLQWEPQDYAGISYLNLPTSTPFNWQANVEIFDYIALDVKETSTVFHHDGKVEKTNFVALRKFCPGNATDIACKFPVSSLISNAYRVDVRHTTGEDFPDSMDQLNKNFEIVSGSVDRHERIYACCIERYASLLFTLNFKKQPWA
jgi:hypothetical protein